LLDISIGPQFTSLSSNNAARNNQQFSAVFYRFLLIIKESYSTVDSLQNEQHLDLLLETNKNAENIIIVCFKYSSILSWSVVKLLWVML